jgi:hypothetical protein
MGTGPEIVKPGDVTVPLMEEEVEDPEIKFTKNCDPLPPADCQDMIEEPSDPIPMELQCGLFLPDEPKQEEPEEELVYCQGEDYDAKNDPSNCDEPEAPTNLEDIDDTVNVTGVQVFGEVDEEKLRELDEWLEEVIQKEP